MPTPPLPIIIPTSLTYRSAPGRVLPLSNLELDGNMSYLEKLSEDRLLISDFTGANIANLINTDNVSINAITVSGYPVSIETRQNTLLARDANGFVYANAVTAANFYGKSTSAGNADTANKLKTAVKINGVDFDGSVAITVADSTKLSKTGGVLTGKLTTTTSTLESSGLRIQPGVGPTIPVNGDVWITSSGQFNRVGGVTRSVAYIDSDISGTAGNVTGVVKIANGGTGGKTAAAARENIGAAKSGVNNDILRLSALTTAIAPNQGGTGLTSPGQTGNVLTSDGTRWVSLPQKSGTAPAGAIMIFPGERAPDGWLICDGTAISRDQYPELFSVIGILYGAGDGSTTFNIPDLRGMFVRGLDNDRGIDQNANRVIGSRQTDAVKLNHVKFGDVVFSTGSVSLSGSGITGVVKHNAANATQIAASETRPVNIALNYCIYTGILVEETASEAFTVLPETLAVNEGSSLRFNISGTNVLSRESLYWECESIIGSRSDFVVNSGTVLVTARGVGAFTITTVNHTTTGDRTFRVKLWSSSSKTKYINESVIVTIKSVAEQIPPAEVFAIVPDLVSQSVAEGTAIKFNITGNNLFNRQSLYWELSGSGDFSGMITGADVLVSSNGTASFVLRTNLTIYKTDRQFKIRLYGDTTKNKYFAETAQITLRNTYDTEFMGLLSGCTDYTDKSGNYNAITHYLSSACSI